MKHITRGLMILVSVAMIAIAPLAMAGDLKIGVVDLHRVLQESPQAKTISKQLETQFKPRQQKLIASQKQLKADVDKIRRDATIMTSAQKSQLQEKITREQRELEQSGSNYQQDLNAAQSKATQAFFDKVTVALNKVAKAGAYDLILQKENVPYSAPQMEITKQIIAALV